MFLCISFKFGILKSLSSAFMDGMNRNKERRNIMSLFCVAGGDGAIATKIGKNLSLTDKFQCKDCIFLPFLEAICRSLLFCIAGERTSEF